MSKRITVPVAIASGVTLVWACSVSLEEMPNDEPCTSVGYSIASRTLACTGDEALANERFEAFRKEFTCNAWTYDPEAGNASGPFACSRDVNQLWCDRFTTCASDLHCLLREVDACLTLLTPADGQGWHEETWDAGDADGSSGAGGSDAQADGGHPIDQFLSTVAQPAALVQDDDTLYFATRSPGNDAGKVVRVSKDDKSSSPLATGLVCDTDAGPAFGPAGLALDDTHVFVAVEGCETLVRLAKDGSDSATIASFDPGARLSHVAVVGQEVFAVLVAEFRIVAMAKDGTSQREVATLDPGAVVTGLAATSDTLFWTSTQASLQKVAAAGGTPVTMATGYPSVFLPVVDGSDVYFLFNQPNGSVLRVAQSGGVTVEYAAGQPSPLGLSVHDSTVVWSRRDPGSLVMRAKSGAEEEVIASDQANVTLVLHDDQYVYWFKQDPFWMLMRARR